MKGKRTNRLDLGHLPLVAQLVKLVEDLGDQEESIVRLKLARNRRVPPVVAGSGCKFRIYPLSVLVCHVFKVLGLTDLRSAKR